MEYIVGGSQASVRICDQLEMLLSSACCSWYQHWKLFVVFNSLSGYGFMDVGLPPASPSDKDIDLKVLSCPSTLLDARKGLKHCPPILEQIFCWQTHPSI